MGLGGRMGAMSILSSLSSHPQEGLLCLLGALCSEDWGINIPDKELKGFLNLASREGGTSSSSLSPSGGHCESCHIVGWSYLNTWEIPRGWVMVSSSESLVLPSTISVPGINKIWHNYLVSPEKNLYYSQKRISIITFPAFSCFCSTSLNCDIGNGHGGILSIAFYPYPMNWAFWLS